METSGINLVKLDHTNLTTNLLSSHMQMNLIVAPVELKELVIHQLFTKFLSSWNLPAPMRVETKTATVKQ